MSKNDIVIDTSKGTLKSPEISVQLRSSSGSLTPCARVQVCDTVHAPARTEMIIRGKVDGNPFSFNEGILEPLNGYNGDKHVFIPNSILKKTESGIMFSVLNPTMGTVILKKNAAVAQLQSFEEVRRSSVSRISSVNKTDKKLPEHLEFLLKDVSEKLSTDEKSKLSEALVKFSDVFIGPDGSHAD